MKLLPLQGGKQQRQQDLLNTNADCSWLRGLVVTSVGGREHFAKGVNFKL